MMGIIFLDIDGVLNRCGFGRTQYDPMLVQECIRPFNRLIEETGARVVLSSSWRYMVLGGAVTLAGFENMLLTHRARCRIIGVTPSDELTEGRGAQVATRLGAYGHEKTPYVVIDDEGHDIGDWGHPLVLTEGTIGLTEADADRAIKILRRGMSHKQPLPHD